MLCSKCGITIQDNSKYCYKCGQKFEIVNIGNIEERPIDSNETVTANVSPLHKTSNTPLSATSTISSIFFALASIGSFIEPCKIKTGIIFGLMAIILSPFTEGFLARQGIKYRLSIKILIIIIGIIVSGIVY